MTNSLARRCSILYRRQMASGVRKMIVLAAVLCTATPALAQQIWLGVRGPDTHQGEAADWDALFKPTPQWDALAEKIQVYTITAGFVVQTPDGVLKADMGNLTRHHIAIGLGMQSVGIDAKDRCGHGEGYGPPDYSAKAAEKLHRLGVPLTYLSLDEPLWFGHYASGWGCHFPVPELAKRVAENIRAYLAYFPNVTLGDIEPVPAVTSYPDWQTTFDSFSKMITRLTGHRLTYLQTDVGWRTPSYAAGLQAVAKFAAQRQLKFGIIYKGDSEDTTGAAWVADAVNRFEQIESADGLVPDQAIFATWEAHPTQVLPITADNTLGYVVARYLLPPAKLRASRQGNSVIGVLTESQGRPIAHASVILKVVGLTADRKPKSQVVSGIVPATARFAIIGMRINAECLCTGAANLLVGNLTYTETEGGSVREVYRLPSDAAAHDGRLWNGIRLAKETIDGEVFAHLILGRTQKFGFNSSVFPVTPGAKFDFIVPIGSLTGTGMPGYATVIWLDGAHHGFDRTYLYAPGATVDATATTDAAGRFQFVGLHQPEPHAIIEFAGNDAVRGAMLKLQ